MDNLYKIELEGKIIGTTKLENADAPMGVLTGEIIFSNMESGYKFFKEYSSKNKIKLTLDDPTYKAIATVVINSLKVLKQDNSELKGQGNYIEGMDNDKFEITIIGYPYPEFEEEFPHHVKEYKERFE